MATMTGTEYGELIKSLSGQSREQALLNAVANGQYPSVFGGVWKQVKIEKTIDGKPRVLVVDVAPDFFAVGTKSDPFYIGGWTTTSQAVVDHFGALLPSKLLAREIARSATKKLTIYDVNPGEPWYDVKQGTPRNIESSGAFIASNKKRVAKLGPLAGDALVDGHMKSVLTKAGGLAGACPSKKCVTIYGAGGGNVDGWAVQSKSTVHDWSYGPDYSHGIRLVRRLATLDGSNVDIRDIFQDPKLSVLVSDEGPFNPILPAPGVATTGGGGGGGGLVTPVKGGSGTVATRQGSSMLPLMLAVGAAIAVAAATSGGGSDDES